MKRLLHLAIIAALIAVPGTADAAKKDKKKKDEQKTEETAKGSKGGSGKSGKDEKVFADVIKDMDVIEGLFTFYRNEKEGKTYLSIKPDQLDNIFMCSITRAAGDGWYFDSGAMLGEFPFVFHRVGKNIQFIHKNVYYRADKDTPIYGALERGLSDSVLGAAKIASAPDPDTGALLIDPSPMFVQDANMVGYIFSEFVKVTRYSFDQPNSYFGPIKSFPENTELDVVATFKSGNPKNFPTLPDARSFQHVYHYSLSALPENDFGPRLADDRVGHFLTMYQDYNSVLKETAYVRYINRWNLEKSEPNLALSPPKEPIVYWLENTIPTAHRDSVRRGIELWNSAFEAIGFKDAIVVKQMPADAEWDPADVRYHVLRWIVQPGGGYAVGPSRTDPFTGQIYDADIRVSADMMRNVYMSAQEMASPLAMFPDAQGVPRTLDQLSAQIGILGKRNDRFMCDFAEGLTQQAAFGHSLLMARATQSGQKIDEQAYLDEFIVQVISHEVGHTLGLRHNYKASTIHANADLQSDEASEMGLTGSVMEYAPVNIADKGEKQGAYYQTQLGPYDYWAIEYAYRPYDENGDMSEKAMLEAIASRGAEPMLAYSTDEDTMFGARGMDPISNRWDLGADPIAFYASRVALSEELWAAMEGEFETDGERYQRMRRIFGRGLGQYFSAVMNTTKYIGGVYNHRDHIGDPNGRMPLEPVSAEEQRRALAFLTENVFASDAFDFPPSVLNKLAPERYWDFSGSLFAQRRLDYPVHNTVLGIQRMPLNHMYDPLLMSRMIDITLFEDSSDALTLAEMFEEVRVAIWSELDQHESVNSFRRALQREHLKKLIGLVVAPVGGTPEDASTLARYDLQQLLAGIKQVEMNNGSLDTTTKAHLDETAARIEAALTAGIDRQVGGRRG